MKFASAALLLFLASTPLFSQTPDSSAAQTASTTPASEPSSALAADLDKLQTAASQAAETIGRLNIDKWKASSEAKSAAHADAESVKRNLTVALPGMISAARAVPADLNAEFKLYRNLNALHEVFGTVIDATRMYGSKADYEAFTQQMRTFESVRRKLGEDLERLTADTQRDVEQLRAQIKTQQDELAASQAQTAEARKQLEGAQAELAKKPPAKKKTVAKKQAPTGTTANPTSPASNSLSQPTTGSPPPKL